jgi:hypothetical protein
LSSEKERKGIGNPKRGDKTAEKHRETKRLCRKQSAVPTPASGGGGGGVEAEVTTTSIVLYLNIFYFYFYFFLIFIYFILISLFCNQILSDFLFSFLLSHICFSFFSFLFKKFFGSTGFELIILPLLSRSFTTLIMPPLFFALLIF